MAGARSLAMALNRLIDAGIDAAQPAHRGPRAPVGRAHDRRRSSPSALASLVVFLIAVWQLEPGRPLALADPGRRVRDLPLPQALHVALPPLARRGRRPRAGRRLGGDHRASCRGRRGRSAAPSPPGSPASTSSTRSSTSRSTARRGCTPWPCASASAAPFSAPGCCISRPSLLLIAVGLGLSVDALYWAGVAAVAGLLAYEHSLVRPGDLRRLDAAFFTMNGVISVAFFAFVLAGVALTRTPQAQAALGTAPPVPFAPWSR